MGVSDAATVAAAAHHTLSRAVDSNDVVVAAATIASVSTGPNHHNDHLHYNHNEQTESCRRSTRKASKNTVTAHTVNSAASVSVRSSGSTRINHRADDNNSGFIAPTNAGHAVGQQSSPLPIMDLPAALCTTMPSTSASPLASTATTTVAAAIYPQHTITNINTDSIPTMEVVTRHPPPSRAVCCSCEELYQTRPAISSNVCSICEAVAAAATATSAAGTGPAAGGAYRVARPVCTDNNMRSGSSELLLEQQQQELRLRKLRELAPKKKNGNRRFLSWRERARFYGTSTLAFFSVTAGASLLFLVPFYVDPAISTLSHNFVEQPTLCTTTRREDLVGIFNCSWSSCREGCTSDLYRCVHIYVTFIEQNITIPKNMTDFTNYTADWPQSEEATLLVNIKGCGYPPSISCKNFNTLYGTEGAIFPCYYSRKNKTVVLTAYDHDTQVAMIIHFFAIPFVITLMSSIALCVMHCDCRCKKDRSHRRSRQQNRRPRIENLR